MTSHIDYLWNPDNAYAPYQYTLTAISYNPPKRIWRARTAIRMRSK